MRRNVLIAGCGFVGGALATELVASGDRIWGLRRDVSKLPEGVEPLRADLRQADLKLPSDLDFVIYAAAADGSDEAAYRATYLDGMQNVLAALGAQRGSIRRVLFTSSTGVYGQSDGAWVDEDSPTNPGRATGKVLLAAERLLLDSGFRATVVRFAGIYGPGRRRIIDQVRNGTATCHAGEVEYMNRIHRDDAAGVLRHVLEHRDPAELYIGADHEPTERCTFLRWLAAELGVPPPRVEQRREPRTRGFSNKRCSNRRLLQSGYAFRFPTYREGYTQVLAALR